MKRHIGIGSAALMTAIAMVQGCGSSAQSDGNGQSAALEKATASSSDPRAGAATTAPKSRLDVGEKLTKGESATDGLFSYTTCDGWCSQGRLRPNNAHVTPEEFNKHGYQLVLGAGCQLKLFRRQHQYYVKAAGPIIDHETDTPVEIWSPPPSETRWSDSPNCYAEVKADGRLVVVEDPAKPDAAPLFQTQQALSPSQITASTGNAANGSTGGTGGTVGRNNDANDENPTPFLQLTSAGDLIVSKGGAGSGGFDRCMWSYNPSAPGVYLLWDSNTWGSKWQSAACYSTTPKLLNGGWLNCSAALTGDGSVYNGVPVDDSACNPGNYR